MDKVETIDELEALYDTANPKSLMKVAKRVTPHYRTWIEASRFVILSTVGPEGTDGTPRGDDGPVVKIQDEKTLLLPDWRGNNRLDSLRNIVRDGRVSLMFMIPGSGNVVRVNGKAILTADEKLREQFSKKGMLPKTVIVITIDEMYFQCAKAIMRSKIWQSEDESGTIPSAGDFLKEMETSFDAETYDKEYAEYAKKLLW